MGLGLGACLMCIQCTGTGIFYACVCVHGARSFISRRTLTAFSDFRENAMGIGDRE